MIRTFLVVIQFLNAQGNPFVPLHTAFSVQPESLENNPGIQSPSLNKTSNIDLKTAFLAPNVKDKISTEQSTDNAKTIKPLSDTLQRISKNQKKNETHALKIRSKKKKLDQSSSEGKKAKNVNLAKKKAKCKKVLDKNKAAKSSTPKYTLLRDKVVSLLKRYNNKYPHCVYIPPKLIPDTPSPLSSKSLICKKNFIRGWSMGNTWARLIFSNSMEKDEGWKLLTLSRGYFMDNFKPKKFEILCAYKALRKSYFLNYGLLQDKKKTKVLRRYSDVLNYRYGALRKYYDQLHNKV